MNPEIPNPSDVATWPAAVVAVVLILAVLVVPSVLAFMGAQRSKRIETTLTANNGGGSVKDSLDRIETTLAVDVLPELEDQGARLKAVEEAQAASQHGIAGLFRRPR